MDKRTYERWLKTLADKRAPAEAEAKRLIAARRMDAAAAVVQTADDSIYGAVAIGRLFRERLELLAKEGVHAGNRAEAEEVFRHALHWMQRAYPEPHTAVEAEDWERGRAEDRSKLVAILGYDPKAGG